MIIHFFMLVICNQCYWFSIDTEVLYSGIVPKPKLWYGMEISLIGGTLSASFGYLKWTVSWGNFQCEHTTRTIYTTKRHRTVHKYAIRNVLLNSFLTLSSHEHEAHGALQHQAERGQPTPSRALLEKGRSLRRRRSTVRVRSVRGGVWVRGDSFSIVPAPDSPLSRGSGFPRSAQKNKRASSFLPLASQWCH